MCTGSTSQEYKVFPVCCAFHYAIFLAGVLWGAPWGAPWGAVCVVFEDTIALRCIRFRIAWPWAKKEIHSPQAKVVPRGLEPRTVRLLAVRSNQLSYETSDSENEDGSRASPLPAL